MATKEQNIRRTANIWTKISNPLRYLNNTQIENLLNNARFGDDVRLQVAYFEIEKNSPIFSACINKRIAGVQSRAWDILPDDDSEEARAQARAVKAAFDDSDRRVEDNLTDAVRHLTLGTFRGRSAVKPFVVDGKLVFKRLDNWNFLRYDGRNYWNPDANQQNLSNARNSLPEGVSEIPGDEVCYVVDEKPLDWIGLTIYLRQLVGEDTWARFVEKQGIPQVVITVPEGTPETDLEKWNYRAQAIYEGGSGALPGGSSVSELDTARAQDPFTAYITHQSEMFCILATGSTMDTLAGTQGASGAGMGSDVASKQNEQFQSLVSYDCKRIQNAMQAAVRKVAVEMLNQKPICHFEYVEQDSVPPSEYLELAQKCQALGIKVDIQKLREITGLTFISDLEESVWTPVSDKGGN